MVKASSVQSLPALLDQIRACRICRDQPANGRPLPHEPRPVLRAASTARIAICGQAPGTRVHASGMPFSDPSGERLRAWLGLDPVDFYDEARMAIIPMSFCFPGLDAKGGDLPPRRECAPAWRQQIFTHLPRLELLVLIGWHAQRWHLQSLAKASLTDTVAAWRDYLSAPSGPALIPLPHPSWRNSGWLKRHPWFAQELLPVLRERVANHMA